MLDAFQQRYLEIINASPYLKSITKPGRQIQNVEYYVYNTQVGSVASPLVLNVPQISTIETQSDSDFAITFISAAVQELVNNVVVYNWNMTLQFQDLSTGKTFFNIPTVMGLVSGGGGFPFVLPAPRILNPNTNLAVTCMNRDTVTNPQIAYVALHGTRIYYK